MVNTLVMFLVLVVMAVVVFLVVKYILDQAEADPPIRKIVLLILLVVFLIAIINLLSGGALWPNPVIVAR